MRTKRVPLKDIKDRGTESNIGEKRKTQEECHDLDLMEEDTLQGPHHKCLKRDQDDAQHGGELEASPAMPPPTQ